MKASILTIGTELLIGQTIDTNSAWMGSQLNALGIQISRVVSIADDHEMIVDALTNMSEEADYVFVTGGLGPTKDDITKTAIATFLSVDQYFEESIYKRIELFFKQLGRPLSPLHREQCYFPEGTQFLENALGTAPGMLFATEQCKIVSMPGVPYEMKSIFTTGLLPMLKEEAKHLNYFHTMIQTAGLPESSVAELIQPTIDQMPEGMEVAYLPSTGVVKLRISARGSKAKQSVEEYVDKIASILGDYIFGYDEDLIQTAVQKLMIDKGLWLGTAESCTGGYIGHMITSIPGSSQYYKGGVVSYSNDLKVDKLGVNPSTIEEHGAVSEEVVKEMVTGCCSNLGVDIAIAISGIAGPGGGSEEKPVGTTWVCVGNSEKQIAKKFRLKTNRLLNIRYSSNISLIMLRKFLLDL